MTESAPIMAKPAAKICPGSLGRVLDGVKARVVDGDGRDVPDGESGEIIVQSPTAYPSGAGHRNGSIIPASFRWS